MMRPSLLCFAAVMAVSACGREPGPAEMAETALPPASADIPSLHVTLGPTTGHSAAGMLILNQTSDGVAITGRLSGLPADRRLGFHIHEVADCSAPDASSAGDHFNPSGQPHGDPDDDRRHLGDLPNLEVDAEGVASVDLLVDEATIDGPAVSSLRHRAIVVHAQADDYTTQPAGDSGDRIACGEISGPDGGSPTSVNTPPPGS